MYPHPGEQTSLRSENESFTFSVPLVHSQLTESCENMPLKKAKISYSPCHRTQKGMQKQIMRTCFCSNHWLSSKVIDTSTLFHTKFYSEVFIAMKWRYEAIHLPSSVSSGTRSTLHHLLETSPTGPNNLETVKYRPIQFTFVKLAENRSYRIIANVDSPAMTHVFGNIPPILILQSLHSSSPECDYADMVLKIVSAFEGASKHDHPTYFDLLVGEVVSHDPLKYSVSVNLRDLRDHIGSPES